MFDDHFIKMDIINYHSFIVFFDLDVLCVPAGCFAALSDPLVVQLDLLVVQLDPLVVQLDHLVVRFGPLAVRFDRLVVQPDHLGCNFGLVGDAGDHFELVVGGFAAVDDMFVVHVDLVDHLAVLADRFNHPGYMTVPVGHVDDFVAQVDHFANFYFAIASNDFVLVDLVVEAVDEVAVPVALVVRAA